jgi:hypothetical protein
VISTLRRHPPVPAQHRGALAAVLRRHWLMMALLSAGLVLRVLAQAAYRPALFYIDSTRYLYHAGGNDPVGYRLPLKIILFVANLNVVAGVQHALGLAMALALYLVLLRRGSPAWLAALATAPVLLDAYQLQIEQTVMPDSWFEALIVAGLVLLAWQPEPPWPMIAAAGLLLGATATVRQVGEILVLPAACYAVIAARGWRRRVGHAALLCAAFALPIIGYSSLSLAVTGHFWLSHSGATTTYGRAAAAADCAALRLPASERKLCPTPRQQASGSDQLEHSPHSPLRPYYASLPSGEASRLVAGFSQQVFRQQPLRVAVAVGRDAVKLFALTRNTSPGDTPISRWQFQDHYPVYPPHASRQVIERAGVRLGGGGPVADEPVAAFLRAYQLHGGYTPGPLLALAALAGLIGSARLVTSPLALGRRRRRANAPAGRGPGEAGSRPGEADGSAPGAASSPAAGGAGPAAACFLFFTVALAVLLTADLFEFSWRYQLPALVTLPPAGALGLALFTRRSGPAAGAVTAAPPSPLP